MKKIYLKDLPDYSRDFLFLVAFTYINRDYPCDIEYIKWILRLDWAGKEIDINKIKAELLPFIIGNDE